jgi:hypothetical protein
MALPTSGKLKLSLANAELRLGNLQQRISLGTAAVRGLARIAEGPISMSDLYGRAFGTPITKTYDTPGTYTWVAPTNVVWINAVYGFGSRGDSAGGTSTRWRSWRATRWNSCDGTGRVIVEDQGTNEYLYSDPGAGYCELEYAASGTKNGMVYCSMQYCPTLYTPENYNSGPSTGAAATAFSKSFPGSTGNVAQSTTQYNNIAVVPGRSYTIVVPTGGRVWFTYDQFIISGNLTGNGTLTIPENTTVTLSGAGAIGGEYYYPGSPYVQGTPDRYNNHGMYADGASLDCSDTPGSSGASNIQHITIDGQPYITWDCFVPGSPAQPATPPSWEPTYGQATTARLGNGTTESFPGSYGPTAVSTTTKVLNNTSNTPVTLTYSVAPGGSLSYSYIAGVYS